jgi:hypothetical protein
MIMYRKQERKQDKAYKEKNELQRDSSSMEELGSKPSVTTDDRLASSFF